MSILDREDSHVGISTSLDTMIDEARREALEDRAEQDLTGVDVWFSEEGFISPYPDRVLRVDVTTKTQLLDALRQQIEEPIGGRVITLPEDLGLLFWELARVLELELGYIPNPDTEYKTWEAMTRNLRTIDALDLDAHFQPIHLPKKDVIHAEPNEDVGQEIQPSED